MCGPLPPRKFAATSATTAGCQRRQGGERFGSSVTAPQRRGNVPVTSLRNVNSSASVPQRRTPSLRSNVAALRIKRRFGGCPVRGTGLRPTRLRGSISVQGENYFAGDVDPDAPALLTYLRRSVDERGVAEAPYRQDVKYESGQAICLHQATALVVYTHKSVVSQTNLKREHPSSVRSIEAFGRLA